MRYNCRSWFLLFALLSLAATPARAETVSGEARVIDGDSIIVGATRVRIWGIDAPEMGTREGDAAKKYLKMLVEDATVRCEDDGVRIQGRLMAKCFIGTIDIGGVMVMSGNARDWRRYSGGVYTEMLKAAGLAPHRVQVARRAASPAQPKAAQPVTAAPAPAAAIPAPAANPAPDYVRRQASRYPTAPAIVVEPAAPFRAAPAAKGPAAAPQVSAAPVAPVSAPTVLAAPPPPPTMADEDFVPATVQAEPRDE